MILDIDRIALKTEEEARACVRLIESRVDYNGWVPCNVVFVNETRKDRVADCTIDMQIRLFNGGQTIGSLIHEMAHNSLNCMMDLILRSGISFVSNGYDDSHATHFEYMLEKLVAIYEKAIEEERCVYG